MSQVTVFATVAAFFEVLRVSWGQPPPVVAFRRFRPLEPGYFVPSSDSSLAAAYASGGFREVVVCLSGAPKHTHDWSFTERCASDILLVSGGRSGGGVLEGWHVRVLAKGSNVRPLYRRLRRHVATRCSRGMCHRDSGTYYADMFCDKGANVFELRAEFEDPQTVYVPVSASGRRRRSRG